MHCLIDDCVWCVADSTVCSGFASVADKYYNRWLHTDAVIHVNDVEGLVRVTGVDNKTGELLGIQLNDGSPISLSPGDNSFDILKGMVSRKS